MDENRTDSMVQNELEEDPIHEPDTVQRTNPSPWNNGRPSSRQCSLCRKRIYFRSYSCRYCKHRYHEKCAVVGHLMCRRRSDTGDDHWTKLLQANEINSNMDLSVLQSLNNLCKKHRNSPKDKTSALYRLYRRLRKFVLPKRQEEEEIKDEDSSSELEETSSRSYSSRASSSSCFSITTLSDGYASRSSVSTCSSMHFKPPTLLPPQPQQTESLSPPCHFTSDSTAAPADLSPRELTVHPGAAGACQDKGQSKSSQTYCHASLAGTISCPQKTSLGPQLKVDESNLVASWPPVGYRLCSYEENEEGDNDSVFLEEGEDIDCVSNSKAEPPDRNSLSDCMIAFSDLQFSERIKTGGCLEMHRGQWHGDVIIHKYDPSVEDVFWTKISMLRMIRHENIALFMGACAEPPNFAIVTSVRKGQSLYEKIHNSKDAPLPLHSKFSIAKQIAQGMGYLHARGIVLERLNSENIFLESKVKIFVLDHSFSENRLERSDCACLPRGRATYFAPEILRTMRIENQQVKLEQNTKESDTFAFGTVLYELFNGRFPHDKQPIHTIIWNVGSGNTLKLNHLKCPEVIKTLIRDSWAFLPSSRPGFVDINKILQTVVHLKKRHSSSEPDSIHKIGVMLGS
ncbi:kinase suppressor of Ras 2 [Lingula anatina]|uniref:Kinase suppressor of Ras 2 n=1 Tax=Lingula anatina TaxID=7574 RepID=A0A1S3II80_LINAN|nr:kinase suppressor of Ras 2 [Lingula anatina]|eukprot:XP_013397833.1 kinase suppressor of Ras 2 [Lingula anatina]